MLRILAICIGILFVISGVLGFIPEFTKEGKLFGTFAINTPRNLAHLAIGFLGMVSGLRSLMASKIYFFTFGVLFLVVAAFGFYHASGELFYYLAANYSDNWLYAILGVVFIYLGASFARKK